MRHSVWCGAERHQHERKVIGPMATALVGGASHADEGLMESFHHADGLMVLRSSVSKADTAGFVYGSDQVTNQRRAVI